MLFTAAVFLVLPLTLFASGSPGEGIVIGDIRLEFILFGIVLLLVAVFHDHTFWVALAGLTVILLYKLFFISGFNLQEHLFGTVPFSEQIIHRQSRAGEWGILLNLLGLLLGFGVLARIFEESGLPDVLPKTFRIEGLVGGTWRKVARVTGNIHRQVRVPIGATLGGVRFVLEETWGGTASCLYAFYVE